MQVAFCVSFYVGLSLFGWSCFMLVRPFGVGLGVVCGVQW